MTEVTGPIRSFYYPHKAIRTELEQIEHHTATLDIQNDEAIAALRERLEFLGTFVEAHGDAEEAGLYPAVTELRDGADELFEWDHRRVETYLEAFNDLLGALKTDRAQVTHDELTRTASALQALLSAHATKEDELLVPLIDTELSPADQAPIVAKTGETIPDEMMEDATKFMIERIDQDDRVDFLGILRHGMSDDEFTAVSDWTKDSISQDEWDDLTNRLPELG